MELSEDFLSLGRGFVMLHFLAKMKFELIIHFLQKNQHLSHNILRKMD